MKIVMTKEEPKAGFTQLRARLDDSEEKYEEVNRDTEIDSLPTEYQKKLMSGELKMADEFDILEDKIKITHWSW